VRSELIRVCAAPFPLSGLGPGSEVQHLPGLHAKPWVRSQLQKRRDNNDKKDLPTVRYASH
jgi:hypothetical protein